MHVQAIGDFGIVPALTGFCAAFAVYIYIYQKPNKHAMKALLLFRRNPRALGLHWRPTVLDHGPGAATCRIATTENLSTVSSCQTLLASADFCHRLVVR